MLSSSLSSALRKAKRGLLLVCALLLLSFSTAALAQSGRRPQKKDPPPQPTPASDETKRERPKSSYGDEVYTLREVDVSAKITSGRNETPSPRRNCPSGRVSIRAVLHKSGKVIDVSVVKGLHCGYDNDAADIVRGYKFTPAMKDGQPVSQAILVEFEMRVY